MDYMHMHSQSGFRTVIMIVLYSPEYLPINGSVSFLVMMCYHKGIIIVIPLCVLYTQIILLINGMFSSLSAQTLNLGGGEGGVC